MNKISEGRKMFLSVMAIFIVNAVIFIIFDDYDRRMAQPLDEPSERNLLFFSLTMLFGLGLLLYRYARKMDERISREQDEQRSKTRRQMTQNIAHELKTPVTSILGYTDTLLDNPDITPDQQRKFLERTRSQAQRLTLLIQDITQLSRMDEGLQLQRERINVSLLVQEIAQECALQLAEHRMTFRNCLPQDIIVYGDPSLLYSIFRNLLDNAIRYAGEGTTVELTAVLQGQSWQFTFSDNGVGVDEKHLPHLFERFYRVDKSRSRQSGGTGLGLAIVKNALMMHGGNIRAMKNDGGGLRLVFTISHQ